MQMNCIKPVLFIRWAVHTEFIQAKKIYMSFINFNRRRGAVHNLETFPHTITRYYLYPLRTIR